MDKIEKLKAEVNKFAISEIEQYGLPSMLHYELSLSKAVELAKSLGANEDYAYIGACLMDIKLGQAFKEGRLKDHVQMGVEATQEFLSKFDLSHDVTDLILNCVAAHHGTIEYKSLEAEICANADCYRFLHPKGVLHFIAVLSKRGLDFSKIIEQAEYKLDEKFGILSLESCVEELTPYYRGFKDMFSKAARD